MDDGIQQRGPAISAPLAISIGTAALAVLAALIWAVYVVRRRYKMKKLPKNHKRMPVADLDLLLRQRGSGYAIRRTYENPLRSPMMAPVLAMGGDSLPTPVIDETLQHPDNTAPQRLFQATKFSAPSREESILGLNPGDVVTYLDQDKDWHWGELNGVRGWFDPTCCQEIKSPKSRQLLMARGHSMASTASRMSIDPAAINCNATRGHSAHNLQQLQLQQKQTQWQLMDGQHGDQGRSVRVAAAEELRSAAHHLPQELLQQHNVPEVPPLPAHLSSIPFDHVNGFSHFSANDFAAALGELDESRAAGDAAAAAAAAARIAEQQNAASAAVSNIRQGRVGLLSKMDHRKQEANSPHGHTAGTKAAFL